MININGKFSDEVYLILTARECVRFFENGVEELEMFPFNDGVNEMSKNQTKRYCSI